MAKVEGSPEGGGAGKRRTLPQVSGCLLIPLHRPSIYAYANESAGRPGSCMLLFGYFDATVGRGVKSRHVYWGS